MVRLQVICRSGAAQRFKVTVGPLAVPAAVISTIYVVGELPTV